MLLVGQLTFHLRDVLADTSAGLLSLPCVYSAVEEGVSGGVAKEEEDPYGGSTDEDMESDIGECVYV